MPALSSTMIASKIVSWIKSNDDKLFKGYQMSFQDDKIESFTAGVMKETMSKKVGLLLLVHLIFMAIVGHSASAMRQFPFSDHITVNDDGIVMELWKQLAKGEKENLRWVQMCVGTASLPTIISTKA
ncbi:unnamed protein product [Dovyalis caffra]|uniref:Uncharacterized protein n=1 Tax=Dovyalis caffra TaxID=77055 RepID=A0AAV1SJF6_9ROSI|nr:unnamed protein product [Dovyalis caffra]